MIPPWVMRLLDRVRTTIFSLFRLRTLGAVALLINDQEEVLLIRQTYGSGDWTLPGGGVQRGETFYEAAVREASEEVGMVLRPNPESRLHGVYLKRIGHWDDHIALYVFRHWDAYPKQNSEIAEVGLFNVNDLPSATAPSARQRIAEWQGNVPTSSTW